MNHCAFQALHLTWVTRGSPQAFSSLFYPMCLTQEPGHQCCSGGWVPALWRRTRSTFTVRQTPGSWRVSCPVCLVLRIEHANGRGHDSALLQVQATLCICSLFPGTFAFSRERGICRGHTVVCDEAMLYLLKSSSGKRAQPPFSVYFL